RWGFPSSHAANAAAAGTVLARMFPRWRWAFALLAGLIGFTRIYVGVHYPGDVAAGFLLGWAVGLLLWQMTRSGLKRYLNQKV
ncbi:MAG: phosphatase PAP2 family protein, partial [Calditrichaeota bacterium]